MDAIGGLREQGTILQPATGQDEIGQPTNGWTEFATGVWADVRYLSGLEAIKAGAEASVVKASIRVRWRAGVTSAMRFVIGATTFQIKSVLPQPGRKYLHLACEVVQ